MTDKLDKLFASPNEFPAVSRQVMSLRGYVDQTEADAREAEAQAWLEIRRCLITLREATQ